MSSSASASEGGPSDDDDDEDDDDDGSTGKPNVSTHLAWIRTQLSLDRTMMSWVRTASSLIGFGFTIFHVMEHLTPSRGVKGAELSEAPRYIALAMIGAGMIVCVIAITEYRAATRYLYGKEFQAFAGMPPERTARSVMQPLAVLLLVVGIFAFVAVLLRA